MAAYTDFVQQLLERGTARMSQPPRPSPGERPAVLDLLARAHRDHRLDVAGPPLDFDPDTALGCLSFTAWACWFLVHRRDAASEVEEMLRPPPLGTTAAAHLSADLTLRLLPVVLRRARALDPRDVLTARLTDVLRHWPLSGVLADIDEPPLVPVDLGQHPGLLLLYAERLAAHPRSSWTVEGPTAPYVELVQGESERVASTIRDPRTARGRGAS